MPLVERGVFFSENAESVHLVGFQATKRYLDPYHVDVGLSLAVDSLLEPIGLKFGRIELSSLKSLDLHLKVIDFFREDIDDALGTRSPVCLSHSDLSVNLLQRLDGKENLVRSSLVRAGRLAKYGGGEALFQCVQGTQAPSTLM